MQGLSGVISLLMRLSPAVFRPQVTVCLLVASQTSCTIFPRAVYSGWQAVCGSLRFDLIRVEEPVVDQIGGSHLTLTTVADALRARRHTLPVF